MNARAPVQAADAPTEDSRPILVADPEAAMRGFLRWVLEQEGFSVEIAPPDNRAIDLLDRRRPELLIVGLATASSAGSKCVYALRARYGLSVPVIALVSDGLLAARARRWGAVTCFSRSFSPQAFMGVVRQVLERA
jgi:DNA-binding response OmpR family regulator